MTDIRYKVEWEIRIRPVVAMPDPIGRWPLPGDPAPWVEAAEVAWKAGFIEGVLSVLPATPEALVERVVAEIGEGLPPIAVHAEQQAQKIAPVLLAKAEEARVAQQVRDDERTAAWEAERKAHPRPVRMPSPTEG